MQRTATRDAIGGEVDDSRLRSAPSAITRILSGEFWVSYPEAPNLKLVCATIRPADHDASLAGFPDADVAGCDIDADLAWQRCRGEAAEYLSQLSPAGDPLCRDGVVRAIDLRTGDGTDLAAVLCLRSLRDPSAMVGSGCAAGPTLIDALSAGLWELIERDAVTRWWHHDRRGRTMQADAESYAAAYVRALRGSTRTRTTHFIDISTVPGLPVVVAYSLAIDGHGMVLGFAAHPDVRRAAEKAARELLQMEVGLRMVEHKAQHGLPLNDAELRMQHRANLLAGDEPHFNTLSPAHAHPQDGASLAETLAFIEGDVFAVDLTRVSIGVPVAKVVAIGLFAIPDEAAWVAEGSNRLALF